MNRNYYKRGAYNVICDSCGFKFKNGELRLRWDGVMVCSACWTPRQPQDLIRARKENLQLPYYRPRPEDEFIPRNYVASLFDYVTLTESPLSWTATYNPMVSETVTIVDQVAGTTDPGFLENVGTTDSVTTTTTYVRAFADSVSTTDTLVVVLGSPTALNGSPINEFLVG